MLEFNYDINGVQAKGMRICVCSCAENTETCGEIAKAPCEF